MYTHDYDTMYYPAMPIVEVVIANPENPKKAISLSALVDSGADTTFIAESHLQALGLEPVRLARVRGIWGGSYAVAMYSVRLTIGSYAFFGVRVAGDKQGQTILGRNVLNETIVTLNGLANVVTIEQ